VPTVEKIINKIIEVEGAYSNNPNDKGGVTCWGITEAVARSNGFQGDMKDLPKEKAFSIYLKQYWVNPQFDKVFRISSSIAEELCDTGVNMGPATASKMLQRSLNVLNNKHTMYPDITVDGDIGSGTLSALSTYKAKRGVDGEQVLLKCLNILQGYRYFEITEAREANEEFFFGWIKNRIEL
jgi:lysozyme family protein